MDPLIKMWFLECWRGEQEIQADKRRNLGILVGAFTNPEMARKMTEEPITTSDEDFEASTQEFLDDEKRVKTEALLEKEKSKKRISRRKKRRRVI